MASPLQRIHPAGAVGTRLPLKGSPAQDSSSPETAHAIRTSPRNMQTMTESSALWNWDDEAQQLRPPIATAYNCIVLISHTQRTICTVSIATVGLQHHCWSRSTQQSATSHHLTLPRSHEATTLWIFTPQIPTCVAPMWARTAPRSQGVCCSAAPIEESHQECLRSHHEAHRRV